MNVGACPVFVMSINKPHWSQKVYIPGSWVRDERMDYCIVDKHTCSRHDMRAYLFIFTESSKHRVSKVTMITLFLE